MKINYKGIHKIIFATIIIFFMQPYFTWASYAYSNVTLIVMYLCLIIGMLLTIKRIFEIKVIAKDKFIGFVMFVIYASYYYCTGSKSLMGSVGVLLQYIFISLFILSYSKRDDEVFDFLKKIIVILLIPAMIFFILRIIGINIPFDIIQDYRVSSSRVYIHYPFSILATNRDSINMPSLRLCGFLDEPGALGTYIAMILVATDLDLKNGYNKILFLAGLMTLSTAFWLIIITYILIAKLNLNKFKNINKKAFLLLLLIIIIAISFYRYGIYEKIFGKLTVNDVRGTQLIWEQTKAEFNGDIWKYIFGDGYYSGNFGSSASWTILIHDVGIVGIIISLIYVFTYSFGDNFNRKIFGFKCIFILSMLQRPFVLTIPYMMLFIFGVHKLKINNLNDNL